MDPQNASEALSDQPIDHLSAGTPETETAPLMQNDAVADTAETAADTVAFETVETDEEAAALVESQEDATHPPVVALDVPVADEGDSHDALHALELPTFADWDTEKLLVEAKSYLAQRSQEELRLLWPALRTVLDGRMADARQQALEAFLAEGGVAMDFHYEAADFLRWKDLSNQYRSKRAAWKQEEDQRLHANLKAKESLLVELKALAERPELPTAKTYTEFRTIQERWKSVGAVPSEQANTLYPTYRFLVDRFYDQLRLSNELRELDYKHNQVAKEALIAQAEARLEDALKQDTLRFLQTLHASWKETGPVAPELKEPLWEKFKQATDAVHDKRREASDAINLVNKERLEAKAACVEQIEAWSATASAQNAAAWNQIFEDLGEQRKVLQAVGHTFGDASDAIWKRFREVEHRLNRARNGFFKERKAAFAEALAAKMTLVDQAEALKDSSDLKGTAAVLKRLQSDWKKTPFVPKGEGDKLWERFRAACNAFFEKAKSEQNQQDSALEENAVLKRALLDEAQGLTVTGREHLPILLDLSKRWKEAGPLPGKERKLDAQFHAVMDSHFGALDMNKAESQKIRYQQKLESMGNDGGQSLEREVQFLRNKLDESRRELTQMEANFSRFTTGKSSKPNPLLVEAQKRIDAAGEEVAQWEVKLKAAKKALQERA
jgi:hypothetical protein